MHGCPWSVLQLAVAGCCGKLAVASRRLPSSAFATGPGPTYIFPCRRSYKSDMESDPFGEKGSVWSFNYFFYNKKLKVKLG